MNRNTVIKTSAGPKKAIPRMEFDFFFMLSCVTLELCVDPFYRFIHFVCDVFAAQSNVLQNLLERCADLRINSVFGLG